MEDFFGSWTGLSSEGVLGSLLRLLETAGDWAGAAAELIGLVL